MSGAQRVATREEQATRRELPHGDDRERPNQGAADDAPVSGIGYSPDPAERTDRYRLVTPYTVRL